jgi:hypothetical protein
LGDLPQPGIVNFPLAPVLENRVILGNALNNEIVVDYWKLLVHCGLFLERKK